LEKVLSGEGEDGRVGEGVGEGKPVTVVVAEPSSPRGEEGVGGRVARGETEERGGEGVGERVEKPFSTPQPPPVTVGRPLGTELTDAPVLGKEDGVSVGEAAMRMLLEGAGERLTETEGVSRSAMEGVGVGVP